MGFNPFPDQNTVAPAPRFNPEAPLTITQTPKSQTQNQFLQAVVGQNRASQPQRAGALTQFVQQAYANQATDKAALDQERKMLDKIFAKDGGIADELATSRARRMAGVMMRTKMGLDRAKRQNSINRMLGGNNTYNDRLYADALARVGAEGAVSDADLEREDLRYLTGLRTGAVGARGRLGQNYASSLLLPAQATNAAMRDDMSVLEQIARLEDGNSVYESPLDQLRRQLEMERGLVALDDYENPFV